MPNTPLSDDEDSDHEISNPSSSFVIVNNPATESVSNPNYQTTSSKPQKSHGLGTPKSDDDDDDDDGDHNMLNSERSLYNNNNNNNNISYNNNEDNDNWIEIDYEDTIEKIPIDNHTIFNDVKEHLKNKGYDISSSHGIVDNETDITYNDDDICMNVNHKRLIIKWQAYFINILDGTELNFNIRVADDFTIQMIKEQVEKDRNIRLQTLSYQGSELSDDKTLKYYNIKDNDTLISRICITIEDPDCDVSTEVLVCEFWDITHTIKTYLQTERREQHHGSIVKFNNIILSANDSIYNAGIKNGYKLEYHVPMYDIYIYDTDQLLLNSLNKLNITDPNTINNLNNINNNVNHDLEPEKIEVYDWWTIKDVKEAYARQTKKPFMEGEKLLSNERQLEEDVPLWKLRIKDNESLMIEREHQDRANEYICAECGSLVKLRRNDSVQCRECFHQIVFKKRTNRVCQYNCR